MKSAEKTHHKIPRLPTWAGFWSCPRCAAALGQLSADGNALKLSEATAVYYRARLTCLACGFHSYWTPERQGN